MSLRAWRPLRRWLPLARTTRSRLPDRDRQSAKVQGRLAGEDRRRARRELEIEHGHLQPSDERENRGLFGEAAARKPHVRGVGGELVERRIDGQPQASAGSLVDFYFGPSVGVDRIWT